MKERGAAPGEPTSNAEVQLPGLLVCATDDQDRLVRDHLPEHVRLTRSEPGCLSFEVAPSEQPGLWTVRERFADAESFRAHQQRVTGSEWGRATTGIERRYEIDGLDSWPSI